MKSEYTGELWTCDACGREAVVGPADPIPGYTGRIADGLGNAWDWYACRKACVSRAIWTAGTREGAD